MHKATPSAASGQSGADKNSPGHAGATAAASRRAEHRQMRHAASCQGPDVALSVSGAMPVMPPGLVRSGFQRDRLPNPADYYASQGIKLLGKGSWRDALCPFHEDRKPSLRVLSANGAFRCMACGAHGGDIVAFHMLRHGLRFVEAVMALGAWEVVL